MLVYRIRLDSYIMEILLSFKEGRKERGKEGRKEEKEKKGREGESDRGKKRKQKVKTIHKPNVLGSIPSNTMKTDFSYDSY